MVVAITISGVVMSGLQLFMSYRLALSGRAAFDKDNGNIDSKGSYSTEVVDGRLGNPGDLDRFFSRLCEMDLHDDGGPGRGAADHPGCRTATAVEWRSASGATRRTPGGICRPRSSRDDRATGPIAIEAGAVPLAHMRPETLAGLLDIFVPADRARANARAERARASGARSSPDRPK